MPANLCFLIQRKLAEVFASWRWIFFNGVAIVVICNLIVLDLAFLRRSVFNPSRRAAYKQFDNLMNITNMSYYKTIKNIKFTDYKYLVHYVPMTNLTEWIMEGAVEKLNKQIKIHGLSERNIGSTINDHDLVALVQFTNFTTDMPEKLVVTVRLQSILQTRNRTLHYDDHLWITRCSGVIRRVESQIMRRVDFYYRENFAQIYNAVIWRWIEYWVEEESRKVLVLNPNSMNMTNVPMNQPMDERDMELVSAKQRMLAATFTIINVLHPEQQRTCLTSKNSNTIWFMFHLIYFIPFVHLVWLYGLERENNMIPHFWIYGFQPFRYNVAFFVGGVVYCSILNTVFLLVTLAIKLVSAKFVPAINTLTFFNFMAFLGIFSVQLVLTAMVFGLCFRKARNCALLAAIAWLVAFGVFSIILDHPQLNFRDILAMHMFVNNFLPIGLRNIFQSDVSEISMDTIMIHCLINALILLVVLVLFTYVVCGHYFDRSTFIGSLCCFRRFLKPNSFQRPIISHDRSNLKMEYFEPAPVNAVEMLYVNNVIAFDKKAKQRLKNIKIRFFRDEITVILGAHETGKTTLLTVLAGWHRPAFGNVYFDGVQNTLTHWKEYRQRLDVLMSENPLYIVLSVKQHLHYLAGIKQPHFNSKGIQQEVDKYLQTLSNCGINGKDIISNLSYSKCRLVALVGTLMFDRPIILLKDPTRHMSLTDQRNFWKILQKEKTGRCIVVTTTSIDEAEEIGDRIAIINEGGRVAAYGSKFFLRTSFGVGFDLIILKEPNVSSAPIDKVISDFIPNTTPDNQIGDEVFYKLPADKRGIFQHMLLKLEDRKEELGIYSIQVSGSDLNEVYMTLGMESDHQMTVPEVTQVLRFINESPKGLKRQHLYALLYKMMLHQASRLMPVIMFLVVMVLFLLLILFTEVLAPKLQGDVSLNLGLPDNQDRSEFQKYTSCRFIEAIRSKFKERDLNTKYSYTPTRYICGTEDYATYLRNKTAGDFDTLGAVDYNETTNDFRLWLNMHVFHSAGVTLNMVHNLILNFIFPENPKYVVHVFNFPQLVSPTMAYNLKQNLFVHLRLPIIFGIIVPVLLSCFVVPVFEEYHYNLLVLQRMAGVNLYVLWSVSLIWDVLTFCAFSIIYVIAVMLLTIQNFNFNEKALLVLLLNLYAVATIVFIYVLVPFISGNKIRAFLQVLLLQLLTGIVMYIFYWELVHVHGSLYLIMSVAPGFSMLDGIKRLHARAIEVAYCIRLCDMLNNCVRQKICETLRQCCLSRYFDWDEPGLLRPVVFLAGSTVAFIVLFFALSVARREKMYSLSRRQRKRKLGTVSFPFDDTDVQEERIRIARMSLTASRRYTVFADQVEERISKRSRRLNTVSFALDRYISMGAYGSHNSGKTNILRQFVGARAVRFGEIYLNGLDIKHRTNVVFRSVGFAAQGKSRGIFTPRQLYSLIFMIKGLPASTISDKVKQISTSLELRPYMTTRIHRLPRDVKQRVNIGICLIGFNKILILDEPTDGMSAKTRRIILNVLRYARFCGKTILFTSYESVECETLADYIIVVDKGELLAIGSPQYIKQKYTKGFYLHVKLFCNDSVSDNLYANADKDAENLIRYVGFLHRVSELLYRNINCLSFYVPVENITFSSLFGSLEKNRRRLKIEEYTIGQGSLMKALDNILFTRTLRAPYNRTVHFGKRRSHYRANYLNRYEEEDKLNRHTVY